MSRNMILPLESSRLARYAVPVQCYVCESDNTFDAEFCSHCYAPMALAHQASAQQTPPQMLADAFRPWVETCIELFGAVRCMFESNFPVDKGSYTYAAYWNACKRLTAGASADEKADLFRGTAARVYRVPAGK